jgi:hypothetical protein
MDQANQRCVKYPVKGKWGNVEEHKRIEPSPDWMEEHNSEAAFVAKPSNDKAVLPQVQWRDANDYLADCQDNCKLPLCVWLER